MRDGRKRKRMENERERETFPGMLHPLMQSFKWAFAQVLGASVAQHNLPLHRHGSDPCLGHALGEKQPVHNLEAGTEICARQLPFLALPPRRCGLTRASSPAPSPTPASAEPALPEPLPASPGCCPCCHQPCDINPWVLAGLHPQRG